MMRWWGFVMNILKLQFFKRSFVLKMKKILLLVLALIQLEAHAETYITVTGASVRKAKVALGQVHSIGEGPDNALARSIFDQFQTDLESLLLA